MGSKGVLLSGIALIIGVYAVGIKKADVTMAGSAMTRAYKIQSEKNAMMGVRAGIHLLRDDDDGDAGGVYETGSFIFMADTVTYTASIPIPYDTKGQITAISNFKGWKTTIKAFVKRVDPSEPWNNYPNYDYPNLGYYRWVVTRSYDLPNANEALYQVQ